MKKLSIYTAIIIAFAIAVSSCKTQQEGISSDDALHLQTNLSGSGALITIHFTKGNEHNHPLFAIWVSDTNGRYLQTLFVSESIGKGIFDHSKKNNEGKWEPGELRRPAALPVWSHAYGYLSKDGYYLPDPEHPVADAISGPTPAGDFILESKAAETLPQVVDLYLELNQSWDWNHYWNNDAFPGDQAYESSAQPSLIYKARVHLNQKAEGIPMLLAGHGHYSGRDGNIYPETGNFTSALKIAGSITISVNPASSSK